MYFVLADNIFIFLYSTADSYQQIYLYMSWSLLKAGTKNESVNAINCIILAVVNFCSSVNFKLFTNSRLIDGLFALTLNKIILLAFVYTSYAFKIK